MASTGSLATGMPTTASPRIGRPRGVNIGDRVGRRDAPEVEWIIDDRHHEVGGRNDGLLVIDAMHLSLVARFRPDQQIREAAHEYRVGKNLGKQRRGDLAAAAASVCECGKPDGRWIDGLHHCFNRRCLPWQSAHHDARHAVVRDRL
jgi:hypothetical protein